MKRKLLTYESPIHRLRPRGNNVVAYTYCGVDPCRKGVRCEGVQIGLIADCKHCLNQETRERRRASFAYDLPKIATLSELAEIPRTGGQWIDVMLSLPGLEGGTIKWNFGHKMELGELGFNTLDEGIKIVEKLRKHPRCVLVWNTEE
jgi:hypothetical protein